jgi:hypothetical protein
LEDVGEEGGEVVRELGGLGDEALLGRLLVREGEKWEGSR